MGTATTYSTARSAPGGGTLCVLSDCAHNLSRTLAFASVSARCTARAHHSPTSRLPHEPRQGMQRPPASLPTRTQTRYSAR